MITLCQLFSCVCNAFIISPAIMWEGAAFCVEEETETQKGWVVCPRPHSWEVSEPGCQTGEGLCLPISALPHEGGSLPP